MKSKNSDIAERVVILLKKIWSGSQTRMANEIGVSQSAISNVVTGRQSAGRKLLAAISSHPLVNAGWLLTGEGDAIISITAEPGRRALFIAEKLFEGLPEDHGDCLGLMLEVPTRFYRPSRYWVEIAPQNPLVHAEKLKVTVGDMVLFEPEEGGWPDNLADHPCIFRGRDKHLQFSWVLESSLSKITLDGLNPPPKYQGPGSRKHRSILLDDAPLPPTSPSFQLQRNRIVAVGIYRCGEFA